MSRFGHYESCGICHTHPCICEGFNPYSSEEQMKFHKEYLGTFRHVSSESLISSLREALQGNEEALETLDWVAKRLQKAEEAR